MNIIPGFPWPPPVLAELREIFRLPKRPDPEMKPVEPPKKSEGDA